MRLGGLSYNSGTENRYRYNGKEYHQELNLGLYDYGARMYDPAIGRWNGVDLLSELDHRWTSYHYTYGNPLRYIDIGGYATAAPVSLPSIPQWEIDIFSNLQRQMDQANLFAPQVPS